MYMMNHNNHEYTIDTTIKITNFIPLIAIFCVIIAITVLLQWYHGFTVLGAMNDFMAAFFLIFGFFKIINLSKFVEAYCEYDLIAQQNRQYAYVYPFIELGLGFLYLFRIFPLLTNIVTLIFFAISSVSVFIALRKKNQIVCACLGAVFKLPMTYVSLLEDLLMVFMAFIMLFFNL